MAAHHVIPRFHLARWANDAGLLEVFHIDELDVREENPRYFYAPQDFNRIEAPAGDDDPWLEHELLGTLDNDASNLMRQLESVPEPRSQVRVTRNRGWHPSQILAPKDSARFAMYVAALAVRSPAWRATVKSHTAAAMGRHVEEQVNCELQECRDPERIEELKKLLGLRYMVADISGNTVPWLSGHLAYRLGEVLYSQYFWAVYRFPIPMLMLGNDPVVIANRDASGPSGSFSQVASARGDVLSVYQDLRLLADDAVETMRGNDFVMVPLDPTRMLVLSSFRQLVLPGRYDADGRVACAFNLLTRKSSTEWVAIPPGHADRVRRAIEDKHPWLARHRARQAT